MGVLRAYPGTDDSTSLSRNLSLTTVSCAGWRIYRKGRRESRVFSSPLVSILRCRAASEACRAEQSQRHHSLWAEWPCYPFVSLEAAKRACAIRDLANPQTNAQTVSIRWRDANHETRYNFRVLPVVFNRWRVSSALQFISNHRIVQRWIFRWVGRLRSRPVVLTHRRYRFCCRSRILSLGIILLRTTLRGLLHWVRFGNRLTWRPYGVRNRWRGFQ